MADSIPQRTISDFKGKLTGGGVRPNLFEVQVNFPDNIDQAIQGGSEFNGETFRFMCKASSLPASNVASIEIPFRGRLLKVAGDRTIDPWTVTVINHYSQLGISDLPGFNFFLRPDFLDEDIEFLFSTFCLESDSATLASLSFSFLISSKRSCAFLKLNISW